MKLRMTQSGKAVPLARGVVIGMLSTVTVLCVLSLITTWLIYKGVVSFDLFGYISIAVLFIAAQTGALVGIRLTKRRILAVGAAVGTSTCIILLLINWLLLGGYFDGIFIKIIMIYLGSAVVSVVEMKRHQGGKNRGGKYRFR